MKIKSITYTLLLSFSIVACDVGGGGGDTPSETQVAAQPKSNITFETPEELIPALKKAYEEMDRDMVLSLVELNVYNKEEKVANYLELQKYLRSVKDTYPTEEEFNNNVIIKDLKEDGVTAAEFMKITDSDPYKHLIFPWEPYDIWRGSKWSKEKYKKMISEFEFEYYKDVKITQQQGVFTADIYFRVHINDERGRTIGCSAVGIKRAEGWKIYRPIRLCIFPDIDFVNYNLDFMKEKEQERLDNKYN